MLTATGLIEAWDQPPVEPAAAEEPLLPIDLSGPHWDTLPDGLWFEPTAPPEPVFSSPIDGPRVAPLDGMRAFAVVAVILYHANPGWAAGGYFGVDVFFVLSGYLITTLLLGEWLGSGGVALRAFWGRRARRLLPALFVMLAVVGAVSVLFPKVLGSPGLLGDTLSTVGYVANWHFIAAHANYFTTLANPSPLQHTWTLAIEEQFYLVWPLVLLVLVGVRRRRRPAGSDRRSRLPMVACAALAGAVASALAMAALTPVGAVSVNRAYYGSDTRAQGLLVGAALAAACLWWGPVRTALGRRLLGLAGLVGAAGIVVMWRVVPESSAFTFHGGFALLAVATAAVIGCVTLLSRHPVAGILSVRPLPYLGKISYGMYLWYWPVLLVMTSPRTHLHGVPLLGARLAVIVGVAALSFHLIETPIHRGRLAGWRSLVVVPLAALVVSLLPLMMPSASAVVPAASGKAALPFSSGTGAVVAARPVRILVVGDSMAGSLGVGLTAVAPRYGAEILNEGSPGCSLAEAAVVRVLWWTNPPGTPCQAANPAQLISTYRSLVHQFDPDVVVYLARSDTLDTELDGTWQHVGEPTFDYWAEARYDQAIAALGTGGAKVVLLTSPYYDTGEQTDGTPWPENDPQRVITDNKLLVAAAHLSAGKASVFHLGALLSPGNQFTTSVDGVTARCSDGVHLTVPGGEWVGARLLPVLVSLGRSHSSWHASQARPALPRIAQPWWYANLPCGT